MLSIVSVVSYDRWLFDCIGYFVEFFVCDFI